jgi:hypothetical protein
MSDLFGFFYNNPSTSTSQTSASRAGKAIEDPGRRRLVP